MKVLNVKIPDETHRRLKLLAAGRDLSASEVIIDLVDRAWASGAKTLLDGGVKP